MKNYFFPLLVAILFNLNLKAQNSSEVEVSAAVEGLRKAMIDADRDQLQKLSSSHLSYGHSNGNIEDRDTFINSLVSGKSDFETISISEQTVDIIDNTALVRHKLVADVKDGGKPLKVNLGILLVWLKEQGEWKLLARQAYKL